jgi:hypothetical protein
MTFSIGRVVLLTKGPAGLPCASCLFDLGEASGMAGAGTCPLKSALLRRLAGRASAGVPGRDTSCDAFTAGFCETEPDQAFVTEAAGLRARLS